MSWKSEKRNYEGTKGDVEHKIERTGTTKHEDDVREIRQAARSARQVTEEKPIPSIKKGR